MVQAKFTSEMIDCLRKLIGESFVSYDGAIMNQTAYGNLQLNTEHFSVELRNEVHPFSLFSEVEDVSCFSCIFKRAGTIFEPFCEEPWKTVPINEKITGVSIVSDTVIVNDDEYAITFDMAVIIKTEKHQYSFSRNWFFSETINLSVDKGLDDVYPISRVIADWNDDGNRRASVQRSIVSL